MVETLRFRYIYFGIAIYFVEVESLQKVSHDFKTLVLYLFLFYTLGLAVSLLSFLLCEIFKLLIKTIKFVCLQVKKKLEYEISKCNINILTNTDKYKLIILNNDNKIELFEKEYEKIIFLRDLIVLFIILSMIYFYNQNNIHVIIEIIAMILIAIINCNIYSKLIKQFNKEVEKIIEVKNEKK